MCDHACSIFMNHTKHCKLSCFLNIDNISRRESLRVSSTAPYSASPLLSLCHRSESLSMEASAHLQIETFLGVSVLKSSVSNVCVVPS